MVSCRTCCVSKLPMQEAVDETWLRIPRKIPDNCWLRGSHNNIKLYKLMLVQSKECVNFIYFAVWEGTAIMSKHDL